MFTHGLDIELSVGILPTLLFPHSAIPHFTNDLPVTELTDHAHGHAAEAWRQRGGGYRVYIPSQNQSK